MSNKFHLPETLKTATRDEWRALVEKALNGKSLEEALTTTTSDDIVINPLYTDKDAIAAAQPVEPGKWTRASLNRPWDSLALIDIPDLAAANSEIKRAFESGATGLWLSLSNDIPYASAALPLESVEDVKTLFDGISLEGKSLFLSSGPNSLAAAALISLYIKESNNAPAAGSFCLDPIGVSAALNRLPQDEASRIAEEIDAALALRAVNSGMSPFLAAGRLYQQAGATEVMELALTLSAVIAYARALEAAGLITEDAFSAVDVSLAATSDIFLTTAKLRAMRRLLARVKTASKAGSAATGILAEMSWADMTVTDPEVNMLRATAATVAAGLGNADALLLLPYSASHGVATTAARRLALNTHIIAQEESHIGTVEDPVAGSFYVESLTAELAEKAWAMFRDIEKDGGLMAALKSGTVREMITTARQETITAIATGKKEITGTTVFPNLEEKQPALMSAPAPAAKSAPTEVEALPAAAKGERFEGLQNLLAAGTSLSAITAALEGKNTPADLLPDVSTRTTAEVEALRAASDAALAATGQRPTVFLANLGSAAEFTARATWARSYFETGGISAITTAGFETADEVAAAFKESGAKIACLCSTDARYEAMAIETAKALQQAGAKAVYLVARPSLLKTLGEEGEGSFHALLFKGNNMIEALSEAQAIISAA